MSDNEEPQREEGAAQQTFQESLEETQRLTTQWSVEDEEEAARERRRRERQQSDQPGSEEPSPEDLNGDNCTEADNPVGLKPAGPWETEEDEGFGDWSQKLEQRKQRGAAQVTEEREEPRHTGMEQAEETQATEELHTYKAMEEEEAPSVEAAEVNDETEFCIKETEALSYSQRVQRELQNEEEVEPDTRVPEEEVENQKEWEEIREERHVPVENLVYTEEHDDRWAPEEEERRRQSLGSEGENDDGTITVKVTERAEHLNRSIQKSNSIKRSEPLLPINKIDDRLEQYTHAIETSTKPGRLVRQPSLEMLSPIDPVANIKNRWETGDLTTATKASPCKDTEGIAIGVSDMITQWGRGKSELDGQASPPRITEVKPGEVLSKKSLWEQNPKSGQNDKNATPNKKYKFVLTGHGKYEKILVDEP